jgi:hypothetical protein
LKNSGLRGPHCTALQPRMTRRCAKKADLSIKANKLKLQAEAVWVATDGLQTGKSLKDTDTIETTKHNQRYVCRR